MEDIQCKSFPCLKILRELLDRKPRDNIDAEYDYRRAVRSFDGMFKHFAAYSMNENTEDRPFYIEAIRRHLIPVKTYLKTDYSLPRI
jgi:hypothetical protein